jgi:hypothetical protein
MNLNEVGPVSGLSDVDRFKNDHEKRRTDMRMADPLYRYSALVIFNFLHLVFLLFSTVLQALQRSQGPLQHFHGLRLSRALSPSDNLYMDSKGLY